MPLAEKRYAEALVDLASDRNAILSFQQDFALLVDLFLNQADFHEFLLSPEIQNEHKKTFLKTLFTGRFDPAFIHFLLLVIDKHRTRLLPGMYQEYARLADKKTSTLEMTIISAIPLEDMQVDRIKEKYRKLYNAAGVKATFQIDSSLIGGLKVRIGDKVVDRSLKSRIEDLKEQLLKH